MDSQQQHSFGKRHALFAGARRVSQRPLRQPLFELVEATDVTDTLVEVVELQEVRAGRECPFLGNQRREDFVAEFAAAMQGATPRLPSLLRRQSHHGLDESIFVIDRQLDHDAVVRSAQFSQSQVELIAQVFISGERQFELHRVLHQLDRHRRD